MKSGSGDIEYIGSVARAGDELIVRFNYTPQRVGAIKAIPRARFDPKSRSWHLPLSSLPQLERSSHFNRKRLEYEFGKLGDEPPTDQLLEEANQRWHSKPLSVGEKDLLIIKADLTIRTDSASSLILGAVTDRLPLKSYIESGRLARWSKQHDSFILNPSGIGDLIRFCRGKRLSFAVSTEASELLTKSAELRSKIIAGEYSPTAEELRESLLYPYLTLTDPDLVNEKLSIVGLSKEQQEAFTELTVKPSAETLEKLAHLAHAEDLVIWLDRDAQKICQQYLETDQKVEATSGRLKLCSSEVAPVGWSYCELTKRAGFSVKTSAAQAYLSANPAFEAVAVKLTHSPSSLFIPLADEELLDLYETNSNLPESSAFKRFIAILQYRRELITQRRYYQQLKDVELNGEPFTNHDLVPRLYPHQRVAVRWLLDTPRAFLGDDMGLGKTLSVLAAYDVLKNKNEVDFVLVICPTSLTRNWLNESANWTPSLKLSLISGGRKEKLHAVKQIGWGGVRCDGLVLNYETLRLDYIRDEVSALLRKRNTLLVIDESQRVKNPRGETFKSFSAIAKLTERRILLSGTPTPKDISDIWTQYFLLDDGERFGRNFYRWLEEVAELGNKYSKVAITAFKPAGVKETIRRAQEIMLRRKKDEVLNLPQKIFSTRYVKLTGEQATRYDEIRKDLLLRMTSVNGKSFIRAIDSILEEYLRAVQAASNPRLIDQTWKGEPAKFKELDAIIEEVVKERDEKIVIWTNYIANTTELMKRYVEYGAESFSGEISPERRTKIVSEFQTNPAKKVLIAVPAAGGVGITLTAAQTAVYIDKTWNGEHWMQSVDRLHRIGQRGVVNIISLSACKIDELISSNLARKVRLQGEVLGDEKRKTAEELTTGYSLPSLEELKAALTS